MKELLAAVLAERFPTSQQVQAEAHRKVPAPVLLTPRPVSVDSMARKASDRLRYDARMVEARKLTAVHRRRRAWLMGTVAEEWDLYTQRNKASSGDYEHLKRMIAMNEGQDLREAQRRAPKRPQ